MPAPSTSELDWCWYYLPITIRILNSTTRNKLFGLSGIYLYIKPRDPGLRARELILSLISLPEEYRAIETKLEIFFTTKQLINNEKSGKNSIQWVQCKLVEFKNLIDPASDKIPSPEIYHFLSNGFKFETSYDSSNNNDIKDSCLLVAKPKFPIYNSLYYRQVNLLSELDDSVALPSRIKIESSPFSLSNVSIFNNFSSIGYLNYKSKDNSIYLSDLKYMDNMIGGVVNLLSDRKVHTDNKKDVVRSLGLIWGNMVKTNGQGELLVILNWSYIFKLIDHILIGELSLLDKGIQQLLTLNCCSESCISEEDNIEEHLAVETSETGHCSTVGITVKYSEGLSYWGSGIIFDKDMILTNRHVVMNSNKLSDSVKIWIDSNHSIELKTPVINEDVFIPFDNQLFDICFIRIKGRKLGTPIKFYNGMTIEKAMSMIFINQPPSMLYSTKSMTKSIGYGLFFNYSHLKPLRSIGNISTVVSLNSTFKKFANDIEIPSLIISSSSCWSGSSGGAVTSPSGQLIGVMVSNGRLSTGVTLNQFNLIIPLDIVMLGYYDIFYENLEFAREAAVKINDLYQLRELYSDLFLESFKL